MPVNTTHPDYDFGLPGWLRARDVLAGEDAVKSAGEKYLPRLDSQSDEEFLAILSPAERTFYLDILMPDSAAADSRQPQHNYSAENQWQLRHRVRKKLERFLLDSTV